MTDTDTPQSGIKITRASKLASALQAAILRGDMEAGEKVSLDRLRARHQVSLSPLREALSRLVSSGLIEMEDQRGYRVAPVSLKNLAEVITLRAALETLALKASIARADLHWESTVLGALHRLTREAASADAAGITAGQDLALRDFHAALIANCGMPLLLDMWGRIYDLNRRYLHLFGADALADPEFARERQALALAAVEGDADAAASLLSKHIDRLGAVLLQTARPALTATSLTESKQ